MERYWTMLIDSLLDPINLYRQLRYRPQPLFAILVAALAQISLTFPTDSPSFQGQLYFQGQTDISPGVMTVGLGMGQLLTFLVIVVGIHAAARILGGRGSLAGGISALGMAMTPAILVSPIYVLSTVTGLNALMVISTPVIAIWGLVLQVLAIREVYELSTARAVLSIVLSIVVLVLIGAGVGLLLSFLFLLFAAPFWS